MGINIQAKTDYSALFSGMNQNSNSGVTGMSSLLSNYASIKNGSYGKLMKAYYTETPNDSVKKLTSNNTALREQTKEDAKKLNKVQTATDDLKESADALYATGTKSLFLKKNVTTTDENGVESTTKAYDTDAIYKAVNSFVNNYNAVIKAVDSTENEKLINRAVSMANNTSYSEKALNNIGISIEEDGTLSLNKETFQKADMNQVKNLFNGSGSFGYKVSAQASMINFAAGNEVAKTATYTGNGSYNATLSAGNVYNSYF